ncbi:hypothetical protein [uncultured Lutibacter sp.]|uniref:hypothetical protein n=1 Tax=uncultured Lutibacter sp. TaxID=437739 RepID=UPI00262AF0FF|nr:hypothetical protein [uncultured Lutibacter sp.]
MKKTLKTLLLFAVTFTLYNCDNDNGNASNETACNYEGFTFLDTNNNTQTLIPESDLFTDFFNTSSNGPEVEIYETNDPGNFNFTTSVVTLNGTGTGVLNFNGSTYTVNVICQRTGSAIGDEMRFDLTASGLEVEFCVVIDAFH